MMNFLELQERKDKFEIADNRMTSYSTSLGGGSIYYWNGKTNGRDLAFEGNEAKIEIYDAKTRRNFAQLYFHSWRPDRIISQYLSIDHIGIKEKKTIYNDVFIDEICFSNSNPYESSGVDLEIVLSGCSRGKAKLEIKDNYLYLSEMEGTQRGIHKIIGFDKDSIIKINKESYRLILPLHIRSCKDLKVHEEKICLYLIVSMAENYVNALKKFQETSKNPLKMFKLKKEEWEKFYRESVPEFHCPDSLINKMYYHIYYVTKSNIYEFRKGYFRYPFTSLSKFGLQPLWFWDTAFHSFYEKWLKKIEIPHGSIMNILDAQETDGHLPFTLCIDGHMFDGTQAQRKHYGGKIVQPFVLPMAIWDIYLKNGDKNWLSQVLGPLRRFDEWMEENRDPHKENLYHIIWPGEVFDNSKRFCPDKPFVMENSLLFKERRPIQPPDFNTFACIARSVISKIARELGKFKIADEYRKKVEKMQESIQKMWSKKIGLYADQFMDNHKQILVKTPGGMIPLIGGIPDREKIKKILAHLKNPKEFWSKYPIPYLSMDDPDYNIEDEYFSYQNGRSWPPINWFIIEGLCRYNYYDLAKELSLLTIKTCIVTGEPYCSENYNPETGMPYLKHDIFNYGWGGLPNDILIRRIMGIQPNIPKNEIYIRPLFPNDWNQAQIKGIKLGPHRISLKLKRKDDKLLYCQLTHKGDKTLTIISPSEKVRVKNETATLVIKEGGEIPHWLTL